MLFSQAFEDRHFTKRDISSGIHSTTAPTMFGVESTAASCLGASGANRRTCALERDPQPVREEVFIAKVFPPCDERLRMRFPKQQSGYLPGRSCAGGAAALR